jgi:hypothetical protein
MNGGWCRDGTEVYYLPVPCYGCVEYATRKDDACVSCTRDDAPYSGQYPTIKCPNEAIASFVLKCMESDDAPDDLTYRRIKPSVI